MQNSYIKTCFDFIFLNKKDIAATGFEAKFKQFIPEGYEFSLPYQLFFKVTSACNLRCKHCFYNGDENAYSPAGDLNPQELVDLARYFVEEINITNVTITGGEPFLQKGIYDILAVLAQNNLYINIITNATLIDSITAKKLAELLNPKISVFSVSLDGVTKETHEKIRGKNSYDRAVNGIKELIAAGFSVILNYTVTSGNVSELPLLYDFCKNFGINKLGLNRLEADKNSPLIPDLNDVFKYTAMLIEETRKDTAFMLQNTGLKTIDFLKNEEGAKLLKNLHIDELPAGASLRCHCGQRVEICADGKVYLCSAAETDALCLGSLKNEDFETIWSKRKSNPLFKERELKNSVCKNCKYVPLCKAGCMAKAYKKYGSIDCSGDDCLISGYGGCNG